MAEAKTAKSLKSKVESKKATEAKKEAKDGVTKKSSKATSQANTDQEKVISLKSKVESEKLEDGSLKAEEGLKSGDDQNSDVMPQESEKTAKAGKRSAKALKEDEEKQAKETRKAEKQSAEASESKPVVAIKQRSAEDRLKSRGKNYRKAVEMVEKGKNYTLREATEVAIKTSTVKFDATVELHIRLNVDPKQADQNIRDTLVLPAGTGKTVRIAVFADTADAAAAKKAGADIAAGEEFLQQLDKGEMNFDVLIATPAMMAKLGKYARVLGPKGLMPNPKSGTVTTDVVKAVNEAKAGKVEYRVDSTGIVHIGIGKVSFGGAKILENAKAALTSIKGNKPSSIKSTYVNSIYASTSMGPSVPVDIAEINNL